MHSLLILICVETWIHRFHSSSIVDHHIYNMCALQFLWLCEIGIAYWSKYVEIITGAPLSRLCQGLYCPLYIYEKESP